MLVVAKQMEYFGRGKNDVNFCRKLGKSLGYVSNHRKRFILLRDNQKVHY